MLTINADDWGGWQSATNAAYNCYLKGRIDSATAMVFMSDSQRAAEMAKTCEIDIGLHLNLNHTLEEIPTKLPTLKHHHNRIRKFLNSNKYALILYNPSLRNSFRYVIDAQIEEFHNLYDQKPSHIDGHQHKHLCSNILLDRLLPPHQVVRRSFSFRAGQKSALNRTYRFLVDLILKKRHPITDYFFSLSQNIDQKKFQYVINLAREFKVELMVHPEHSTEYSFLMSEEFQTKLHGLDRKNFLAYKRHSDQ